MVWYLYLSETPVSHLLTALSVIYSFSASSFWLSPSSCRCSLINEPTFLAFIFLTSCFEYNSFCLICHPTLRRIDDFRRKVRKKFFQTRNFFRRSRGDHRSPFFINIYKKTTCIRLIQVVRLSIKWLNRAVL